MKLIRNCKDCGFFRYTNPTNYHFKGAAICSYRSKKLHSPYEIPIWCHLEDAPNHAMHLDGEDRCECMQWEDGLIDSSKCSIHGNSRRR